MAKTKVTTIRLSARHLKGIEAVSEARAHRTRAGLARRNTVNTTTAIIQESLENLFMKHIPERWDEILDSFPSLEDV